MHMDMTMRRLEVAYVIVCGFSISSLVISQKQKRPTVEMAAGSRFLALV